MDGHGDTVQSVGSVVPDAGGRLVDVDAFARAQAVSLSEVGIHLAAKVGQAGPGVVQHPGLLEVLEYSQKFAPTKDAEVERALREVVFGKLQHRSQYLATMVLNLAPETVDEVVQLIPQLSPDDPKTAFSSEDDIQKLLDEIAEYRNV